MRSMLLYILEAVEFSKFAGGDGDDGSDAPCATLYAGGCGGDVLCASLYARGCGKWTLFAEVMCCVLLCMLEAVEGWFCLRRRCAVCYSVCWRMWRFRR